MEVAQKRDPGAVFHKISSSDFRMNRGCTIDNMQ